MRRGGYDVSPHAKFVDAPLGGDRTARGSAADAGDLWSDKRNQSGGDDDSTNIDGDHHTANARANRHASPGAPPALAGADNSGVVFRIGEWFIACRLACGWRARLGLRAPGLSGSYMGVT